LQAVVKKIILLPNNKNNNNNNNENNSFKSSIKIDEEIDSNENKYKSIGVEYMHKGRLKTALLKESPSPLSSWFRFYQADPVVPVKSRSVVLTAGALMVSYDNFIDISIYIFIFIFMLIILYH
jgi:hypothetical protein